MKKLLMLALGVGVLMLLSAPPVAQAQQAEVSQAIKELTDFPANGKRTTVDLNARGGADVGQMGKAAGLLQDALSKTSDSKAKLQLELATAYAKANMHKEARLSAQGALHYLCQSGGGAGCEDVPKYGSYVAP
ncbi:MAG: hypothetical protein ACREI9_04300 [Nitrospiraceae bacterium]